MHGSGVVRGFQLCLGCICIAFGLLTTAFLLNCLDGSLRLRYFVLVATISTALWIVGYRVLNHALE